MTWLEYLFLGGLIIHSIRLFFVERHIRRIRYALTYMATNLPGAVLKTIALSKEIK